eukprot:COSAG06_NODE_522_length_14708_cov_276.456773_5_plen_239_part_00
MQTDATQTFGRRLATTTANALARAPTGVCAANADAIATVHMVRTTLHRACEESRWSEVRRLVRESPADAREPDEHGRLPLHTAASAGALLSIQRLLFEAYPLGLLRRDAQFGRTPLDWTVMRGNADAVEAVQAWGAVVDAATQRTWSPLRERQLSEPHDHWVVTLAEECAAPPEVLQDLRMIGDLARALARQVRTHTCAVCRSERRSSLTDARLAARAGLVGDRAAAPRRDARRLLHA